MLYIAMRRTLVYPLLNQMGTSLKNCTGPVDGEEE